MFSKNRLSALLPCLLAALGLGAQVLSPDAFFGHAKGERFVPQHRLLAYFEHVAANSPLVEWQQYGSSYEGRPLMCAFVGSAKNLRRIEELRAQHLRSIGLLDGEGQDELAIVWLSFGVHGNEGGASNAAPHALYELLQHPDREQWLDNTLLIIDPCLNPDGYNRYAEWYAQKASRWPEALPEALEHEEPWPSGRLNHYLFDLNRDWAWATQAETQARLRLYGQWMPHVHADFHEMDYTDPYYFAPAAEPFHPLISDWQREAQMRIGLNHARHFDARGWLYFTREVFDLFYPSYGDTYPSFNGAIGMTYEQGGHGRAGLAIALPNGDTLRLRDRIEHHVVAALSTIEASAREREALCSAFGQYFATASQNPPGQYKSFVVRRAGQADKIAQLCAWFDAHGIRYGRAGKASKASGWLYREQKQGNLSIAAEDLLVPACQPKGHLVQVLLAPQTALSDSLTYDITAWALPYALGLEAYALERCLAPGGAFEAETPAAAPAKPDAPPYAYVLDWDAWQDARRLGRLLQRGLVARMAQVPFRIEGQDFAAGSLLLTRADNPQFSPEALAEAVRAEAPAARVLYTGFGEAQPDLGSAQMRVLRRPRVALCAGEDVSATAMGEVWHFFERDLEYPLLLLPTGQWQPDVLAGIDVIIMPAGHYRGLGREAGEHLAAWLRQGGRLVALQSAIGRLAPIPGIDISMGSGAWPDSAPGAYAERERAALSGAMPGAVFRYELDQSHPLAFGLGQAYFALKTTTDAYPLQDSGWNVATSSAAPQPIGFVGQSALAQQANASQAFTKRIGQGTLVCLVDDPLFRSFWQQGKLLFANAVFLGF